MKDNLIQQFKHLEDGGFIHNQFNLLQNDQEIIRVHKLTRPLIHYTKQLIFYENIKQVGPQIVLQQYLIKVEKKVFPSTVLPCK